MYGRIVLGVDGEPFEEALDAAKDKAGTKMDNLIPADALKELCEDYKAIVERETGAPFPQKPRDQLNGAVEAVFKSWNGARAIAYRVREKIDHDLGTAVNVQTMVFGNRDDNSGTGVGFTRNAATGDNKPYGDFLVNAQGEDVVAGIRNTEDLDHMKKHFPVIHADLLEIFKRLEEHYTRHVRHRVHHRAGQALDAADPRRQAHRGGGAEDGRRHDQGRPARGRTAGRSPVRRRSCACRPSTSMPCSTRSSPPRARCSPRVSVRRRALPSAAVYFTADDAAAAPGARRARHPRPQRDQPRRHPRHDGLEGHPDRPRRPREPRRRGRPRVGHTGDRRRRGRPHQGQAVHGVGDGDVVVEEGDVISIDGTTGTVVLGAMEMRSAEPPPEFETILKWADAVRKGKLGVRANADTGEDAANARELGAEGIGLCRTEHMFLAPDRLPVVREMILASTPAQEEKALEKLRAVQEADFMEILDAMDGLPVTVRLLDPPLHEFLPSVEELRIKEATKGLSKKEQDLLARPSTGPSTTR
jgi:pyruvate, orthophosphate dikinase